MTHANTDYPFTYHMRVVGNQEDRIGNPIPFVRVLGNRMRADGARYMEWKEFLKGKFYDATRAIAPLVTEKNPITARMHMTFKNDIRGDLDNIGKGVLDALLHNDKYVDDIHYTYAYGEIGSIDITLIIKQKTT